MSMNVRWDNLCIVFIFIFIFLPWLSRPLTSYPFTYMTSKCALLLTRWRCMVRSQFYGEYQSYMWFEAKCCPSYSTNCQVHLKLCVASHSVAMCMCFLWRIPVKLEHHACVERSNIVLTAQSSKFVFSALSMVSTSQY